MTINNFNADTPQLKLVENLLRGFTTLQVNNAEPYISKDFTFKTLPKHADLPDEPKIGFFEKYGQLLSLMTKLEYNVHEAIEAKGKVILHHSVVLHTPDGDKLDYDTLSIFTLVGEDKELKIDEFKDFSDPEKRKNLHSWVAKAVSKMAA